MGDDAKQEREAVLTASEKEQLLDYVRWVVCPCCEGAAVNYPPSQGCIVCGQDGRVLNSTANRIGDLLERYKLTLRQPQTDALKIARDAINGLLDIAPEENLDSEQAGRAYGALCAIDAALKESK